MEERRRAWRDPRAIKAAIKAEKAAEKKRGETTLANAILDYVEKKRRSKDALPLKDRTKADYLAMVAEPRVKKSGEMTQAGPLHPLANKSIYGLSADDIRAVHAAASKRSGRWAAYAMQVMRAVLNWYGIVIADNPLGKDVAGRDRIKIPPARATGRPIPPERVGAWWLALDKASNAVARDYLRFLVLTGCRPSEPKKIMVADCDPVAGRVVLRDTKNRSDHTILLSRQAAEIVERNIKNKKPGAPLFEIVDAKKTIASIAARCGTAFSAKDLRSTFASIAEELVSAYTLKKMMNHANAGDITGAHYIRKSDSSLRSGWQGVADFIETAAKQETPAEVVDLATVRETREVA